VEVGSIESRSKPPTLRVGGTGKSSGWKKPPELMVVDFQVNAWKRDPASHRVTEDRANMSSPHLRIYPHRDEPERTARPEPNMTMKISDLFPILAEAYRGDYLWVEDFADDKVMVTSDLYELVHAFAKCRPSA
jgi:hypothetical protein